MAYSTLKALLKKAAARTVEMLWQAIADAVREISSTGILGFLTLAG